MTTKVLTINLFGACAVESVQPGAFAITGAKHRALFALLATAPFGRRSRTFLQETLWGASCYDTGRQSLRRALSDVKQAMGESFAEVLSGNNSDLELDLSKVYFLGHVGAGPFLEGLDVRERRFLEWVAAIRANPGQLAGLFSQGSPQLSPILPAVCVLPFRVVGGDSLDGVLGDWIAEEVCRSLSRSRLLAVISHLSCREFAASAIDISAVRTALRADYCVTGTLRRAGGELVLDADFVDTRSGRILWTRQFARRAERFMEDAAEGIGAIVAAIGAAIAEDALVHIRGVVPAAIEDHRLVIAGVTLMHRPTLRDFARARDLLEEAARRAPYNAEIQAWLGKWYVLSVFNGWATDVAHETRLATDATARALDISPDNPFCLTIDGFVHTNLLRRLDVAERRYATALDRNPNSALSWLLKGVLHAFRDEGSPAVGAAHQARRLSPLDPFGYFYDSLNASAHLATGDYAQALEFAERSLSINDRHLSTLRAKIIALHYLDRGEEAALAAAELLRRQPDFTIESYRRDHPASQFKIGRKATEAFQAVGLPQG